MFYCALITASATSSGCSIVASATSDLRITTANCMFGEGQYSSHIVRHGDVIASAAVGSLDSVH